MNLLEQEFTQLENKLQTIFRGSLREIKHISNISTQIRPTSTKVFTDLTFMGSPENLTFGIRNIKAFAKSKLCLEGPKVGNDSAKITSIYDKVRFKFNKKHC